MSISKLGMTSVEKATILVVLSVLALLLFSGSATSDTHAALQLKLEQSKVKDIVVNESSALTRSSTKNDTQVENLLFNKTAL